MKAKSIYISSKERASGTLVVTMGIMELLQRRFGNVCFFRPVIHDLKNDSDTNFVLQHYSLNMEHNESYGFTIDEVETFIAQDRFHDLLESLIIKFKTLEKKFDFIVCEGLSSSFLPESFDINLEIAKNLGTPFISVISGKNRTKKEIIENIKIQTKAVKNADCSHFGVFINRLEETININIKKDLPRIFKNLPIFFLPEIKELDTPTIAEVVTNLNCKILLGDSKADLTRVVKQSKIACMNLEHFLTQLEEGDLIIVSGDRLDIVFATISANFSKEFPTVAGILLTGGLIPNKKVIKLIKGISKTKIPVLSVNTDTYNTAVNVNKIPAKITIESDRKIAMAKGLFAKHVDIAQIEDNLTKTSSNTLTPVMFEYSLFEKARQNKKTIVLPESYDERVLRAAEILLRRDVVDIILLGEKKEINHLASSMGINLSKAVIIDPKKSPLRKKYTDIFYNLRKVKGLLKDGAKDALTHYSYFGTMMVYNGDADGMVSGAIHTTGDTIRPALQIIKTKPNTSIVSSIFFMCLETKVLIYGDCAVNKDPSAKELAEIAITSAQSALTFGIQPRIAMLSYSTGHSGEGSDVDKVREATKIVQNKRPDLLIEGPIQYDAAIDMEVAKTKLPKSKVAGAANVFIFPDLNTGNNTYKAVQRSSKTVAIGPVLQGLKKPINDLSRGCGIEDIVNTVVITAIQGQENTK